MERGGPEARIQGSPSLSPPVARALQPPQSALVLPRGPAHARAPGWGCGSWALPSQHHPSRPSSRTTRPPRAPGPDVLPLLPQPRRLTPGPNTSSRTGQGPSDSQSQGGALWREAKSRDLGAGGRGSHERQGEGPPGSCRSRPRPWRENKWKEPGSGRTSLGLPWREGLLVAPIAARAPQAGWRRRLTGGARWRRSHVSH